MIAEIGRFALILALTIALLQAIVPLIGAQRRDGRLMAFADSAALAQAVFVALAFASLVQCFVVSDFSVAVVAENSHTDKPLLYKISGTWGNHEGSMLLWVLILALFGAGVALTKSIPPMMKARTLAVQAMIGAGFLAFSLFTSDPFARLSPAPAQGAGLNPLLQDPGLASHPPFLYLGYVGFSTAFSFAVAALIGGRADAGWARHARPWALAAWVCLTIGIALGSLWAYYELGWGGFWFWDPVENASLMPWLIGTAFVHSILVVEKRHALTRWTLLLGILTFSMSLIGTFVVRSGVLTSVHAFAVDPARGVFILALLGVGTGGALALYGLRLPKLEAEPGFDMISREGGLVVNNWLLLTAAATVFLGTFYPLFIDLIGDDKISVGPPYYAITFAPLMIPALMFMVIGPALRWRRDTLKAGFARVAGALIPAGAAALIALLLAPNKNPAAIFGAALAGWLVFGSLLMLARRARFGQEKAADVARLMRRLPRTAYGVALAHLGAGLLVLGIVGATAWKQEGVFGVRPGDHVSFAGYEWTMESVEPVTGPNYTAAHATLDVSKGARAIAVLTPERRFYPARQSETTEAAICTTLAGNLYAAIGDRDERGVWTLRLYAHPLAIWIWLGAAAMALGGALSLSSFWLRARAPAPAAAPAAVNA
jgi:cytochrome c-type biogenesis protein CcmF